MKKILAACVLLFGLISFANAILIDFDSVPPNQNPQGVEVFIGDTYDSTGIDLYSKSDKHPRWNFNAYNNPGWFVIGGYQTPPYFQNTAQIAMNIGLPATTEVSMDLFTVSSIQLWIYDQDNQQISGITGISPNGSWKTKTITAPEGKFISRIVLQGTITGAVVAMDNLNVVPEPSTIWLLCLGAISALSIRRLNHTHRIRRP